MSGGTDMLRAEVQRARRQLRNLRNARAADDLIVSAHERLVDAETALKRESSGSLTVKVPERRG